MQGGQEEGRKAEPTLSVQDATQDGGMFVELAAILDGCVLP
jgi:hypothetical protein